VLRSVAESTVLSSVWGARGLLVFTWSTAKLLLQLEMIMVTLMLIAAFRVVPEFDPHKRLAWRLGGGLLAILASSIYLSVVMTKRARRCTAPHQPAQAENARLLQKEGDRVILS
jgi:hypothetical protein